MVRIDFLLYYCNMYTILPYWVDLDVVDAEKWRPRAESRPMASFELCTNVKQRAFYRTMVSGN